MQGTFVMKFCYTVSVPMRTNPIFLLIICFCLFFILNLDLTFIFFQITVLLFDIQSFDCIYSLNFVKY